MTYQLEVCIDNLESLQNALEGGATRIELCSSLSLGGLTPSAGLMKQASRLSSVPVYAMIRPRQGDFLFNEADVECMLDDIEMAKDAGMDGIVIGALTADGQIDMETCEKLVSAADRMGITFHRAIDQCRDVEQAIERIIELGCERVLTSGQAKDALSGIDMLRKMRDLAGDKLNIMVGAGVNAQNVSQILDETGSSEVHLSGKSSRKSHMEFISSAAQMGSEEVDDFAIPVTSINAIRAVSEILQSR
ncbi:putative Cytoplasmic copper homeostasis protein cutC [Vibrio nigripulchritudo SO65]|uniref:copper homeostasis protein CutC n=1 Tax=Vibrio nigripulchritudo TaxID=28173 RepID=UPI0003B18080|nr:copper homeostasis protein CutC [Vibrio nigripulchritudo]CCN34791.1 putative Cytoplasmic copper homeostasis protein cutC [Vibrio nigripulchritudo AM115]CCN43112.1 putative Cytoplasmic copper homeostasis protein cutC [Vibrio nigripulchritudo FTn2]CCN67926.1 putative Cytoplasmic copper homeostasis protein cutC [Vibrio nigripulchritudo POn4]CCN74815.1 putative Cytoplasmic copper homeostasis protein cutC [Vibrio nigripulchritudo SO65]